MVCYIVPLMATLIAFTGRRAFHSKGSHGFWLNIMLFGGALFGLVDHFWHGELFLIGANWASDLALGGAITLGITAGWGVIVFKTRIAESMHHLSYRLGILKTSLFQKKA